MKEKNFQENSDALYKNRKRELIGKGILALWKEHFSELLNKRIKQSEDIE